MTSENDKTLDLEEAIRFNDLLSTGTSFKINNDSIADTIDQDIFDDHGSDGEDNFSDEDNDSHISPWKNSFDELKMLMVQVPNEYGTIYKRIVIDGSGDVVGDNNCQIKWTYSMFFEKVEQSFDSNPKLVTVNRNELLWGLQLAVGSMRRKEEAHFIIGYDLMFGAMGCPPRIKPKADVLLVANLISFNETGDENACDNLSEEDRRKFHILKDKIIELQKNGRDHYKNHRYRYAIKVNQSAIRNLEFCQVSNEIEQKEQQQLLNEMYSHQSSCYVKTEEWKKVCSMVNELRRRTNVSRNVTILLNEAIALSNIEDDFERSIKLLRSAQKIEPHNEEVNQTLKAILEKEKKYKQERKNMWQKAFELKQSVENQSN